MSDPDSTIPEEYHSVRSVKFPPRYKSVLKILSFLLVVLFVLAVVFQVCAILVNTYYSEIGAGIWCGIVYAATSVMGLLAVRSHQSGVKAMTTALLCMAACSVCTSLALMIIALLSLTSTTQGAYVKLSVVSNAVLAGVGFIGLAVSIIMIITTAICMSSCKRVWPQPIPDEMQNVKKDSIGVEFQPITHRIYPPSVATVSQPTAESNGSTGSDGIYESLNQISMATSASLEAPTLIEQFIEPIYAVPIKKKIHLSSNLSTGGDFDIEVDDRNENEDKVVPTRWFNPEPLEEPIGSDVDDSEYSRNIKLPKEDVIVHPPPK